MAELSLQLMELSLLLVELSLQLAELYSAADGTVLWLVELSLLLEKQGLLDISM
jgi:hypothetical protein